MNTPAHIEQILKDYNEAFALYNPGKPLPGFRYSNGWFIITYPQSTKIYNRVRAKQLVEMTARLRARTQAGDVNRC